MKYKIMIFSLIFIFVLVWIAGSLEIPVNTPDLSMPTINEFDIANVSNIISVYMKIATFNIEGLPSFISIIFWVFNILFIYLVLTELLLPLLDSNPWTVLIALIGALIVTVTNWLVGLMGGWDTVVETTKNGWDSFWSFDWITTLGPIFTNMMGGNIHELYSLFGSL